MRVVVFPFIIAINKGAVAIVVASFGPDGARNNNATAMRLTTRMSETPVLMAWRRGDLEMPRLRPRRSHWAVDTFISEVKPLRVRDSRPRKISAGLVNHRDLDPQTCKSARGNFADELNSPSLHCSPERLHNLEDLCVQLVDPLPRVSRENRHELLQVDVLVNHVNVHAWSSLLTTLGEEPSAS